LCYEIAMRVEWDGKVYELERSMLISQLLQNFSLSRESHLVVVNGKLLTEDLHLGRDDSVRIIRVISGG
jgi:sulfur carrier protein ThiS